MAPHSRNRRASFRILIGPCEIAGYYSQLTEGFHALGVRADFVTYSDHPFAYGGETCEPRFIAWMKALNKTRARCGRLSPRRVFLAFLAEACRFAWFITALTRYQVFIFGYGQSLLRGNIDLPVLRLLRKRVVSNLAHGSEARPPFVDGALVSRDGAQPATDMVRRLSLARRKLMDWHQRYASVVVGAPYATTPFARRRIVNWFALGIPSRPAAVTQPAPSSDAHGHDRERAIRVLHAPSHPAAKGSPVIHAAIERLRSRGYWIDFIALTGKPVAHVHSELRRCDFVVDQLYSDTPLAGLATEAGWFGKPSVVAGYAIDRLASIMPPEMWPPSKLCHPDQIEDAIEQMIDDRAYREALGLAAQSFVHTQWAAHAVAARYLQLITGDVPEHWWIDPARVVYVEGWGQSADLSRERIRALVSLYGVQALQLSHRPDLEQAFLEFAGLTKPE